MINELDCTSIRKQNSNLIHWRIVRGQKLTKHLVPSSAKKLSSPTALKAVLHLNHVL